jgi:hypothetical protein
VTADGPTWVTAASNEAEGAVQVEYLPGVPRQSLQVLALTGHYAIVAEGDDLLIVPRIEGGDAVGGKTLRDGNWPGGAEAALDAGIIGRKIVGGEKVWGAHIRIRGDDIAIFADGVVFRPQAGGGITAVVARDGDDVIPQTSMTAWIAAVTAAVTALDPAIVVPTDFGYVVGSSGVLEST